MPYPDPAVTANVYCAGFLDDVLVSVVAPAVEAAGGGYGWVMRYGKCGEHLKVRFHGDESTADSFRSALETAALELFGRLEGEPAPETSWRNLPAIDREDEAAEDYPDRTLLWTRYRRSHVSLGSEPFLDDDGYVDRFTRVLGLGLDRALSTFTEPLPIAHRVRQSGLLKVALECVGGFGLELDECVLYLRYHRDWLLRSLVQRAKDPSERTAAIISRFDAKAESLGKILASLSALATQQWRGAVQEPEGELGMAFARLEEYLADRIDEPSYAVDPFASNPRFPVSFKALHGIANQFGLGPADEAFTYHLLLRSVAPAPAQEVVALTP
ncbi:MAG: hypothetical protein AAF604_16495 [Acidobacteriota bacterium]